MMRAQVKQLHESNTFSLLMAFLIVSGFLIDIAEAQVSDVCASEALAAVWAPSRCIILCVGTGHRSDTQRPLSSGCTGWQVMPEAGSQEEKTFFIFDLIITVCLIADCSDCVGRGVPRPCTRRSVAAVGSRRVI